MPKKKILAVENDFLTQKMLKLTLSKHFDIDVFENNTEFCKSTLNNEYDLVLMDIPLSDMQNSCELAMELRKSESFKNKPIIALTSFVSNMDKKKAYDAGIDHFLEKPILPNELIQKLLGFIK